MFECEQHVESLILSQVLHTDTVVDVPQLLSPDCVGSVHLRHLTVRTPPSLGGGGLEKTTKLITSHVYKYNGPNIGTQIVWRENVLAARLVPTSNR